MFSEKLSRRPLPAWAKQPQFGVMIRWGLFAVPGYAPITFSGIGSERYKENMKNGLVKKWHIENYGKDYEYIDFLHDFTAENWNANEFARMAASAGATYIIFPARERDKIALWPRVDDAHSISRELGRDLVGEMERAARRYKLHFGIYYHSHWPVISDLRELVATYRPDILWFDDAPSCNNDKMPKFIRWLYEYSPVKNSIVINDRFASNTRGRDGDIITYKDRWLPESRPLVKWEHVRSVHKGWGYNRMHTFKDWMTADEVRKVRKKVFDLGGNFLLSFAPDRRGTLPAPEMELLKQLKENVPIAIDYVEKLVEWVRKIDEKDAKKLFLGGENAFRKRIGLDAFEDEAVDVGIFHIMNIAEIN